MDIYQCVSVRSFHGHDTCITVTENYNYVANVCVCVCGGDVGPLHAPLVLDTGIQTLTQFGRLVNPGVIHTTHGAL